MIFCIGDTHGGQMGGFDKINIHNFPLQKELTKDDYVIIAGDFGCVWGGPMKDNDRYWQDYLDNKNFTTLFIDGNHENFDILDSLPVEQWNGGKISKINDSVYHLKRGQVFEIDGVKIFTMGGGISIDKNRRIKGKSWWPQESPSRKELDEGLENLKKHNNKVDYVISHSAPKKFIFELCGGMDKSRKEFELPLDDYLDYIYDNIEFKQFLCGHYHIDKSIGRKFRTLIDDIVLLDDREVL